MSSPIRRMFFCCFFFFSYSLSAIAWNATGHMLVANIAYQHLQPNVRLEVDKLLSFMQTEYPHVNSILQAAIWLDTVRAQKIETYARWHYIDMPFSQDGTPLNATIATDNAFWAMQSIRAPLKNAKANHFERARLLTAFIHIVGDLHQPLHTVSRLSHVYPEGDKGGNLYFIRNNNSKTQLHAFWDQGAGAFAGSSNEDRINEFTQTLMTIYPPSYFGAKLNDLDPTHWLQEGMQNAQRFVYTTPEQQTPSAEYIFMAQKIAGQEVALAGYRLAALLNQLLVTPTR